MKVIKINLNLDFFLIEKVNIKLNEYKDLNELNTNKKKNDTLYYTKKYISLYKNKIKKTIQKEKITTAFYKDFESYLILSDIIETPDIRFDIKKSLPQKVLNKLLNDTKLKKLTCYFIPSDYVHELANKNISIKFTNDMLFTMEFIESNNLKNLKSIYYKKVITFNNEKELKDNLTHFLNVNQNIKLIHIYFYSNEAITTITNELKKHKIKDTDIFIHQNEENIKDLSEGIKHLKKVNKKYKNTKREIKIIYSEEFFKNNIFRELTINGIKLCMIAVFYIGIIFVISDKYQEYVTIFNLRLLEESLGDVTNGTNIDEMDDTEINPPEENPEEDPTETPVESVTPPTTYVNKYANIPTSFDKLKKINSEVVGWVSVNNTKINYPVTQHTDNKYYLENDIYNRKVITGWIFMDYRNDPNFTDQNTIVYGHNTTSGYMFGDLKNTANKEWYTNPDNQIITFKTLEKELHFKIFSIYRTDYTTDYLNIGFYNNDYFIEFIDMIKKRSIHNFNVNITPEDKILTLSSCTGGNNRRIVMHAVMLK